MNTTTKISAVIVGPSQKLAEEQIQQAAQQGADLVELRFDLLEEIDPKALLERYTIPMIFTYRTNGQQKNSYFETLKKLAAYKPAYLDIEHHLPRESIQELKQAYPTVQHIVSYHNFDGMPEDLGEVFTKPGDLYKVAVYVHNTIQALEVMRWAKKQPDTCIVIAMGPYGQISRILLRGPITYAPLSQNLASAPGQLTLDDLIEMYRFRSITEQSSLFGLIGNPVDKSISNVSHNKTFAALGPDAVYVKMNLDASEISRFLQLAKEIGFKGLSVTMPLKEAVMEHLDYIDPQARAMGAVNTLKLVDGKWHGFNTDGFGALNALEAQHPVANKRLVIIGAGGAAKAIAVEASSRKANVIIANRDRAKAERLAEKVGGTSCSLDELPTSYDIMINCTPSLMPIKASSLVPGILDSAVQDAKATQDLEPELLLMGAEHSQKVKAAPIKSNSGSRDCVDLAPSTAESRIIMDIHTRPKETELLLEAQKSGCTVVYGYKMFIEQAIGQYALWYDDQLDRTKCRTALEEAAHKLLG